MILTLVDKKIEAEATVSFFYKPNEKMIWQPGQYLYITLPKLNYKDERGATRHFTIASSPTEGEIIQITSRIRKESGYKQTWNEMPLGSQVEAKGPQGTFIFDEKQQGINHIFLAGGIGITPFRSFIKYAIDMKLNCNIKLIYSNSTDSQIAFKKEFENWEKESSILSTTFVVTKTEGRIDKNKLGIIIGDNPINNKYWLVGGKDFVDTIERELLYLSIKTQKIVTEKFTGY